jgi:hypothetical protein
MLKFLHILEEQSPRRIENFVSKKNSKWPPSSRWLPKQNLLQKQILELYYLPEYLSFIGKKQSSQKFMMAPIFNMEIFSGFIF